MKLHTIFTFIFCLLFIYPQTGDAQRRRHRRKPKVEAPDTLRLRHVVLQLDTLQARINSDYSLQALMMSAKTVAVVDSNEVAAHDMMQKIVLPSDCGSYVSTSNLSLPRGMQVAPFAQCNGFGDKLFFAARKDSAVAHLYQCYKMGDGWSEPEQIPLLEADDYDVFLPFLMPDGVTLYFSAKNKKAVGGYDLFVTRFDNDRHMFLRPENIGLPFSTLFDDVLYAIDERNDIGWYITQNGGIANDSVCIYTFVPSTCQRLSSSFDSTTSRRLLKLTSIGPSLNTPTQQAEADKVRRANSEEEKVSIDKKECYPFIINDNKICLHEGQLRTAKARTLYRLWVVGKRDIKKLEEQISHMRLQYHKRLLRQTNPILKAEEHLYILQDKCQRLAKEIRQYELNNKK